MTRRVLPLVTAALAAVPLLAGCSSDALSSSAEGGKLEVVATVAPITSIAAQVGGDRVKVRGMVPEGTNSHTFEPPPSTAEVLSKADIVLLNGLDLEDPTKELAQQNAKGGSEIVEVGTRSLPESDYIYDFSFPEKDGKPNPHLWTDPLFAIRYAEVIRDVFSKADPANAAVYAENTRRFVAQATQLSDALKTDQATVAKRELLTYHDAYAYFGRDYGWRILGAIQPSSFAEPTPAEVAGLIDQIRAEKVPAIFGSEVFPSPVLEQIGRETGARYVDTLRDDDLPGSPGDPEHSWQGLMRFDYVTMITTLGGRADRLQALPLAPTAPDAAGYPQ